MIVTGKKLLLCVFFVSFFIHSSIFASKNETSDEQVLEESNLLIEEKPEDNLPERPETLEKENETTKGFEVVDSSELEDKTEELPLIEEAKTLVQLYGDRPEVEKWRNIYLSEKWRKVLFDILENAVEYRIYVRKCISESEVPIELEYLPVVESGYKISAKSKSGAVGMWQFMANSVRPFLRLNEYLDERYDPWLSTKGGILKLKDNYKIFNDWAVAIAAYNCGNGAMTRAIKNAGTRDYWQLVEKNALPKQTAEYVPKLIAIADLAENAEKYGIELPHHDSEYMEMNEQRDAIFDYVTVKKAYSLSSFSKESGVSEKILKKLNPALTKGFTPPAIEYKIRMPSGTFEAGQNAIAKIKPIEFPFQYKVVKGDSLWSISRKYGVTVQEICDTNGIKENAILRIGKILYIPASKK